MSTLLASLDRIREYLRTAPREELKEDWERVKEMKLQGPTYDDLVGYSEEISNLESPNEVALYSKVPPFNNPSVSTFTSDSSVEETVVFITDEGLLSHPEEFLFLGSYRYITAD